MDELPALVETDERVDRGATRRGDLQRRVARGTLVLVWGIGLLGIASGFTPNAPPPTIYRILFWIVWLVLGTIVGSRIRRGGLALRGQSPEDEGENDGL